MFANSQSVLLLIVSLFLTGGYGQGLPTCPDPTELLPYCACAPDLFGLTIDCSNAQNEDQLEEIFTTATFPTLDAYFLIIKNNQDLKNLTRNVFGELTFNTIFFNKNALEYIDDSVFLKSNSTLEKWVVLNCSLHSTQAFPFNSLSTYTKLTGLTFEFAGVFDVLPKLSSNSLDSLSLVNCELQSFATGAFDDLPKIQSFTFSSNKIASIEPGLFDQNPKLEYVFLYNNNLEEIRAGTFSNLPVLKYVTLNLNDITTIEAGSFSNLPSLNEIDVASNNINYLDNGSCIGCPKLTYLSVTNNELTSLEPGIFDSIISGHISISDNFLTTLDENWLRIPLINLNEVTLFRNPLECGCNIAWLFAEPSLMRTLTATCENGTWIEDLDSSYFSANC